MAMQSNPTKRELLMAMACHAVISAYKLANAERWPQVTWEELPDEIKDSNVIGVREARRPDATPASMHARWKATRMAAGWRWGPVKSEAAREHPNIVERYTDLPVEERRKDQLFLLVVRGLDSIIGADLP